MSKKMVDEVRIKPDGEGGHHVTVHHKAAERMGRYGVQSSYIEPTSKNFGSGEGHEMLAHVANTLQIPEQDEPEAKDNAKEEAKEA